MKLLQINTSLNSSSTGKITNQIGDIFIENGHESFIMYSGRYSDVTSKSITHKIGSKFDFYVHAVITRIFDKHGFSSNRATKKMLKTIELIQPDVIHLHNLHGYYLNVGILFKYLATSRAKIVWTLHDCWTFTGHCCHFEYVNCEKWIKECNSCPQKSSYPSAIFIDNSKVNFQNKRKSFNSISNSNMTIVPVSSWLNNKLKYSFLNSYKSKVIHNGIDLDIFKPQRNQSFIEDYNLKNKYILLGVASVWTERKGFNEFIKLSKIISKDCVIVLVGVSKRLQKKLSSDIISIEKTSNQTQLAEIYSCSDLYLNLTFEDTYPSTNLESIACGTPVISYNTGGSPESLKNAGVVVNQGDLKTLFKTIMDLKNNSYIKFSKNNLRNIANENFNKNTNFKEYVKLYKEILEIVE
jgi:putative colanic acid biosynthesis glycosyltransferase